MPDQMSNQPYYKIKFTGLEDADFGVMSYAGEEEISGLYEYRIYIAIDDPNIDSSKILNKDATFTLIRSDQSTAEIHGIISQFQQFGHSKFHYFYKVVLVPRLWNSGLTFRNEVYQNAGISDLIKAVVENNGLTGSDYKIDLKNNYPVSEFVVQYRETDYNFLSRRLEHFGVYFYFDQSGDKEVVCFTDDNSNLPKADFPEDINFNENQEPSADIETILELTANEKVVTGKVQLKDYNYLFPEKQLMAESKINSDLPGTYYDYGDNFEDEKAGSFLAKIRNQEFLAQSRIFTGKTDSRLFSAGYRFTMTNHFRDSWNEEFIITKISRYGSQKGLFVIPEQFGAPDVLYECRFEAIPYDIDFRPVRKTPIPKISGIMSAKLESGAGDEYAYLDEHGRYKAKMLFDLSDKTNGEASLPIRLTQSYSGAGYGIHFPNHKDAELLWACVDGDVDRPVGIGTVPNPSQASPVVSNNKTHNIIRTAAGNEILIDDKSKETQISFTTSDSHKILMDDKDDKIEVTSKDKHKITMDDKNQNITITTKDGHTILLDDKNTKIVVTSKKGHFLLIDDTDGSEKIQMSDKPKNNNFIIDIQNNKLLIETKEGSIDIQAPKGEINVKSKTFKLETEGDTELKAANIKSEAKTDYKINATNISTEAKSDLKQKGMTISSEASTDNKIKGLNTTVEASLDVKIKGTLSTVEASGINTIKGAMVKIN